MQNPEKLLHEIAEIERSGVLGRSPVYARLLRYLADATTQGRVASEIEIATDVFGKGGDFDSNQDSIIRVYVHNLRQRLDRFYDEFSDSSTNRITVPRGEYKLVRIALSEPASEPEFDGPAGSGLVVAKYLKYKKLFVPVLCSLLLANLISLGWLFSVDQRASEATKIAQSNLWSPLLTSDLPLLVVVGDYYIFAELDSEGQITRMVREFDINSQEDLGHLLEFDSERPNDYMDLDLTYLPQSTAFALKDLLRVVYASHKRVNVLPASKLRVTDLKSNDILYVGYLSALGILEDFVFSASQLRIGDTYDELVHTQSGQYFFSNAGIPEYQNYRDYGFVSAFKGPASRNHVMVVAGTRDSGLMQMAQVLSAMPTIESLKRALESADGRHPHAYEALFEVTGSDRMSLDALLVHNVELDDRHIWAEGRASNAPTAMLTHTN